MGFARTNHVECSTSIVQDKPLSFSLSVEESIKDLLQEEEENTEVLPQHISKAAAKGEQEIVLGWLGPPPVPASRVNAMWKGHTLLHEAVAGNRTELAWALLDLGAQVDPRSSSGFTPLEEVLLYNCSDRTARLLLTWGATMDPRKVIASENTDLFELIQTPLGGRRCIITGLKNSTVFNGQIGVAVQYIQAQDIYVFQVDGFEKPFTIGPTNLIRQDHVPKYEALVNVKTTAVEPEERQPSPRPREEFPRIKPRISTAPLEEWGILPPELDWDLDKETKEEEEEKEPKAPTSDCEGTKFRVEPPPLMSRLLRATCDDAYCSLTPVHSRV